MNARHPKRTTRPCISHHCVLLVVFLGTLISANTLFAQQPIEAAVDKPGVDINIKPSICVAPRGQRWCISKHDIDWLSNLSGDYCLVSAPTSNSDVTKQAVDATEHRCWDNANQGHHSNHVELHQDLDYIIRDADSEQTLNRARVRLAMLKPHRKYPRRRSRLPWSVIKP